MAIVLDMSISAYTKLENAVTKLTVERLFKIADILETPLDTILSTGSSHHFTQTIESNGTGYQQEILNLYTENKETLEELIKSKNEIITHLNDKIKQLKLNP